MNLTKDEIVKGEILKQAQKLFQQYGLKKTTMDEIALACGKAKSTLYHYYTSKEEVFDEVVRLELIHLRVFVKDKVDEVKSLEEKLRVYFSVFHKEIINKVNLYKVVKQDVLNSGNKQKYFHETMAFEISYITRILEDGYDAGEFIQLKKDEIPWFSEILIAAFLGIVQYSIESDFGFDQSKLEQVTNFLIPKLFS